MLSRNRRVAALLIALVLMLSPLLCACGEEPKTGSQSTVPVPPSDTAPHGVSYYSALPSLSELVTLGAYEGMTVTPKAGQSDEDAIWEAVMANAKTISPDEGEVAYYFNSLCAQYRYLASLKSMEYEELLRSLNLSEAVLLAEATEMSKKDLVVTAVLRNSGVILTETEKETLFDKYAEKFASDYGYSPEYVSEHLREPIYEAMLYDKVTEHLLTNNTVVK